MRLQKKKLKVTSKGQKNQTAETYLHVKLHIGVESGWTVEVSTNPVVYFITGRILSLGPELWQRYKHHQQQVVEF